MIALTLVGDADEDVFLNFSNIVGIVSNNYGSTDIICVSRTIFTVKETPLQVLNLINNKVN